MTDEELIARLRAYREHDERSGGMASFEVDECIAAADRIEALTEQLAAAQHDAKEAEAYAEELERDRRKTYEALLLVSRLHSEVEDKLAKAVDAINVATRHEPKGLYPDHVPNYWLLRATLAEIKGESHE